MESESRDRVASLPFASPAAAAPAAAPNAGVPQAMRPRAPSLIPNLDEAQVEIIKQGWINKQGGAKGGRKNWKRRWFVLKEDCLYYKESPESSVLLGVMGVNGCHILDLGCLTESAPPAHNETQTVCHECKKPFTFLDRKHHCRHCGNTFCNADSTKRIAIPKYGFHSRVRVCDTCYETVAVELESSEVVIKLLELTGEKPDAADGVGATGPTIAAHAQAMAQLKARGNLTPSAHKRTSLFRSALAPADEKKRFTLPSINKPHLFALKNSERELWLHADCTETRLEWVQAIRGIQKRKAHTVGGAPGAAGAGDASSSDAAAAEKSLGPSWEIPFRDVTVLNKVGVGAFGEVFRARLWGTEVACKTLRTEQFKDADALLEDLKKEVSILSQLRHPNVVLYIGASTAPPNVAIMTEWCSRGSLYDVLHDYTVHINAKLIIDIATGIAQGLNYLHSLEKKIIHRDLKSHNILVNKSFQVKVADFGLSHVRELQAKEEADGNAEGRVEHKGPRHYGIFGTPEWMAPEVMEGSIYTEKIDVYSYGILLSELVTRQMPFHDRYKISSYMDVVDAVLDQGAVPTIPNWCENLLGGLVQACVSRVPQERPSFTEIIMRLREVESLDDSVLFFQFDLPRLRELMRSAVPAIQSLAASEVAVLLQQNHIRRRSSPEELAESGEVAAASPSPSASPMSARRTMETNLGGITSPIQAGNAFASNHMSSAAAAVASTSGGAGATGAGAGAAGTGGGGARSSHVEGDLWILDNDDAFDFLERFTSLLSSSHREVQLHSCQALLSLLRISSSDRVKRAQDRELIIQHGGLASLVTLLLSEQEALSHSAGAVLLLLTEDLNEAEQRTFTGLDTLGLTHLQALILSDIDRDERALAEIQKKIAHKKRVLEVIATCAARGANDALSPPPSGLKKPRAQGKRSIAIPLKFMPGSFAGGSVSSGSSVTAGAAASSALPRPCLRAAVAASAIDSDDDDDRAISQQLLDSTISSTTADPWALGDGRGRAETAQPPSGSGNDRSPDPSSPALQALFAELQQLVASREPLPEKFSEWYTNSQHHGHALRYDLEGDAWSLCLLVLLPDELRLFNSVRDEPDEPLFILRTRVPAPPDAEDDTPQPAKVRMGAKHGLPHCFTLEDCGSVFTFCAGDAGAQEDWRSRITGRPREGATMAPGAMAAHGQTVAQASMAPAQAAAAAAAAAGPAPVPATAAHTAESVSNDAASTRFMVPRQHAEADPTVGRDIPRLELPTPPFAKRYRNITYHGYAMLRDRSTNQWLLKYLLLVGSTLRVFDSHRSSPHDPAYEHEVDPYFVNVSASSSDRPLGANQFFIRLHSSSVQFDCWADCAEEKEKWIQALSGDALSSSHSAGDVLGLSSSSAVSASAASSSASPSATAARIGAFASYYGHIDYYGYLYRKRKLTNRWLRAWVVLVDSEIHYYNSPQDACDEPRGTLYISTNSGRAFAVKQSSKRPHCLAIVNPSRTFYLAAETEREYLGWANAIHQNVKRLANSKQNLNQMRSRLSTVA